MTELAAAGTWQDPESVSNDERADNVLINNLDINEQVLYARMINAEETTLIP